MNWDEFESIIEAANIQSRLYIEDWAELEKAFYEWKEDKELVLSDEELEEIGSL